MDRQTMLKVLVPVGGLAVLLLLVAVVIAVANMEPTAPTDPTPTPGPSGHDRPPAPLPPPVEESEKFTFALDGPEWKDIGGGLKIWDVTEGTGSTCPPGASVKAHYSGWLTNGYRFDFSRKGGSTTPVPFSLNGVVEGWKQGIPGMKVGGVRRLYIPSALGYPGGNPQARIPPGSDLVFEVELAAIQ